MKTAAYICDYARAQLGRPYWFGTFGQTASAALYQSKKKQYPSQYKASDFPSQYGKRVHDCAGLIKGALWSDTPNSSPKYNASQDYSANKFFTMATSKGPISSMPDQKGILVFKGTDKQKSHIGVYVGNGRVIEAKGHRYGVVESTISSGWKYWGKCNLFSYDTVSTPAPAPAPVPAQPAKPVNNTGYTDLEIRAARDCIRGRYGNGMARRNNLARAGFNYSRVQACVNKILRGEIK